MSGRYSAAASTSGINTANSANFQIRPTGTSTRLYIVEIGVNVAVAPTNAPSFYLARSTAIGTVTTTLAGQAHEPSETAANGTFDSVFSVQPTFSTTNRMGQAGLAVTAGGQIIWTFYDAPIVIAASASSGLVIANANASGATTGTFTAYARWEE